MGAKRNKISKAKLSYGFNLLELAISLMVFGFFCVFIMQIIQQSSLGIKVQVVASQEAQILSATKKYVSTYHDAIVSAIPAGGTLVIPVAKTTPTGAIPPGPSAILPSLQSGGYLDADFVNFNPFQQQFVVLARIPNAAQPNSIEVMVTSYGGEPIQDGFLSQIAQRIGDEGGFILANQVNGNAAGTISGLSGGWSETSANWTNGTAALTSGHVMALLAQPNGSAVQNGNWLARINEGTPELNTMHTNIDGNTNNLNNVNNLDTQIIGKGTGTINVPSNVDINGTATLESPTTIQGGLTVQGGNLQIAGNTGISFSDYGGGFYMSDANNIQVQNGKNLTTTGTISSGNIVSNDKVTAQNNVTTTHTVTGTTNVNGGVLIASPGTNIACSACTVAGQITSTSAGVALDCTGGKWVPLTNPALCADCIDPMNGSTHSPGTTWSDPVTCSSGTTGTQTYTYNCSATAVLTGPTITGTCTPITCTDPETGISHAEGTTWTDPETCSSGQTGSPTHTYSCSATGVLTGPVLGGSCTPLTCTDPETGVTHAESTTWTDPETCPAGDTGAPTHTYSCSATAVLTGPVIGGTPCVASGSCTDPSGTSHANGSTWDQVDTYPSNTCAYMATTYPSLVAGETGGKLWSAFAGDTTHNATITQIDKYSCSAGVITPNDTGAAYAGFPVADRLGWSSNGLITNIDNLWNGSACKNTTCSDSCGTHTSGSAWSCGSTSNTQACPAGDTGTETGTTTNNWSCSAGVISSTGTTFSGWNTSACVAPTCHDAYGTHTSGSTWACGSVASSQGCPGGDYGTETGTTTSYCSCSAGTISGAGSSFSGWDTSACIPLTAVCSGPPGYSCPGPLTYNGVLGGGTGGHGATAYYECAAPGGYLYKCELTPPHGLWEPSCLTNPNGCY